MKFLKTIIMIAVLSFIATASGFAADAEDTAKKAAPELKNQSHCPVMGGRIDSTVYSDVQGQRVYHCCPGCSRSLKADPDKFFKKAAEQGVLFENIQETCPVSGEKLTEKTVYTDFEGRRVYFCCEKCIAEFDKDPAGYLKKLGEKKEMGQKQMPEGHTGHSH